MIEVNRIRKLDPVLGAERIRQEAVLAYEEMQEALAAIATVPQTRAP